MEELLIAEKMGFEFAEKSPGAPGGFPFNLLTKGYATSRKRENILKGEARGVSRILYSTIRTADCSICIHLSSIAAMPEQRWSREETLLFGFTMVNWRKCQEGGDSAAPGYL